MKRASKYRRRLDHKSKAGARVSDNKRVGLLPPTMTLEATFASVKPKRRPLDFKKMRDSAVNEYVEGVARN